MPAADISPERLSWIVFSLVVTGAVVFLAVTGFVLR